MKKLAKELVAGDLTLVPKHEMSWLGKKATMLVLAVSEAHTDKRGPWLKVEAQYQSPYRVENVTGKFFMRPTTSVVVL